MTKEAMRIPPDPSPNSTSARPDGDSGHRSLSLPRMLLLGFRQRENQCRKNGGGQRQGSLGSPHPVDHSAERHAHQTMRTYKVVVFGDGAVGKSAITVRFIQEKYLNEFGASIVDEYRKESTVDGETTVFDVVDTAGQEDYRPLLKNYFKNGDGFLAVYSICNKNSFLEVEKLRNEILAINGTAHVPMVLLGNKCDLSAERAVSTKEGEALAAKFGGVPFFETSAKDDINITEAFAQIAREIRWKNGGGQGPAKSASPAPAPANPKPAPAPTTPAPSDTTKPPPKPTTQKGPAPGPKPPTKTG
eukprot:Sspe_Gene.62628::Locus_35292_Transcript_1_1_Confidence_1.000_Length_1147::g.62628::m.62628